MLPFDGSVAFNIFRRRPGHRPVLVTPQCGARGHIRCKCARFTKTIASKAARSESRTRPGGESAWRESRDNPLHRIHCIRENACGWVLISDASHLQIRRIDRWHRVFGTCQSRDLHRGIRSISLGGKDRVVVASVAAHEGPRLGPKITRHRAGGSGPAIRCNLLRF
jgi:hypothetical protein